MFALTLTTSLIVGAPALKDKPPDGPPAGQWKMERYGHETGPLCPAPSVSLTERTFEYGDPRPRPDGFWVRYKAKFLRVAGEGRADLTPDLSADVPANPAIWKVEGDRLTICIGQSTRPTDFTTPPGSCRLLIVLRRVGD